MIRFCLAACLVALSACAAGPAPERSDRFDVMSMQRALDERGIGFGLARVPGEDAVLLQVRFRTSDADGAPDADPNAAAAAVAPEGCTVQSVEQQPDGAYKVAYACAH